MTLALRFLGGAGEVGRSCIEVSCRDRAVLLDCGVNLAAKEDRFPLRASRPVEAIIASHAHLDHTGMTPWAVREYGCRVVATPPTIDLSELLLTDALRLSSSLGRELPYTNEDIMKIRSSEVEAIYHEEIDLDSFKAMLYCSGHVLGSSMVYLEACGARILYTSDFSARSTRLLPSAEANLPEADILIVESTYGGDSDSHPALKKTERALVDAVKSTLEAGGRVLIPAFALGRAQEVLSIIADYMRSGYLPEYPVFVDGMIREVNKIYFLYWEWLKPEVRRKVRQTRASPLEYRAISDVADRSEVLEISEPYIVVTTSGMLEGGPVVEYLREIAPDSRSLIVLTGYQVESTRGRALLDGAKELELPDGVVKVRAQVHFAELSAHADQKQILQFTSRLKGVKRAVIVHGELEKSMQLARKLEKLRGYSVHVPKVGDVIKV